MTDFEIHTQLREVISSPKSPLCKARQCIRLRRDVERELRWVQQQIERLAATDHPPELDAFHRLETHWQLALGEIETAAREQIHLSKHLYRPVQVSPVCGRT